MRTLQIITLLSFLFVFPFEYASSKNWNSKNGNEGTSAGLPLSIQGKIGPENHDKWPIDLSKTNGSLSNKVLDDSGRLHFDFQNKKFIRNNKECGSKDNQRGSRKTAAVLLIDKLEDVIVSNGHFQCSTQNTVFISDSKNIILDGITSYKGSDNGLEIRNSEYVIVKNSVIGFTDKNKCVETENSIVIFYKVDFHSCERGFAGEKTSSRKPELVVFINTKMRLNFTKHSDALRCDNRVDGTYGLVLVEKLRTNSKNDNCPTSGKIPAGLIKAVEGNDIATIREILAPIYQSLMN